MTKTQSLPAPLTPLDFDFSPRAAELQPESVPVGTVNHAIARSQEQTLDTTFGALRSSIIDNRATVALPLVLETNASAEIDESSQFPFAGPENNRELRRTFEGAMTACGLITSVGVGLAFNALASGQFALALGGGLLAVAGALGAYAFWKLRGQVQETALLQPIPVETGESRVR